MEFAVQRSGALHHLIGERQNVTGLAEKGKCGFLGSGLLGFQPAQKFVAGNDREGESFMLGEILTHTRHDEGILFEAFGENIGVEEDRRLGH